MAIFTDKEADRAAALTAGADVTNESPAEAAAKFNALRRMALDKGIRVVDMWELPEIQRAIDRQMRPKRYPRSPAQEPKPQPQAARGADRSGKEIEALQARLRRVEEDKSDFRLATLVLLCGTLMTWVLMGIFRGQWDLIYLLVICWTGCLGIGGRAWQLWELLHARKH